MPTPSAARGRDVRQRLLNAAVELIPELGWPAVSTRILAERAGVTPSVVHYHFASVPAVLQEAAIGVMQQAVSGLDALFDTAGSPAELVDAVLTSVQQYTGADPTSLLFIEAYLAATRDHRFGEQVGALLSGCRARFAGRLTEYGVPDPEGAAAIVFAALDGLVLHRGLGIGPDIAAATASLRPVVAPTEKGATG
ncbi:TetR/AcrR family transcriptional regulator [Mycobacterium sp. Y57]|uniref:TetR/AcrR family transcriptional regulator n=1 Tax=Mycolicibacterium xanthum TaxID=2796469 RepID=UPI001C863FFD|nr:TetR/AcrR family transcriptional regulator [Mycolicibacterium xanthum]MBX7435191.1 TetR/AcrR family transcriptional regulator [Mycolicibacterium xanthum]